MDKVDKIKLKQLIAKLAQKYNLSEETIKNIVESPYHFTYEKLKDLDLDEVKSEDEANELKTNFNYKGLGKLYLNYPSLKARQIRKNSVSKINKQWKK
jgi:hypothetical protein